MTGLILATQFSVPLGWSYVIGSTALVLFLVVGFLAVLALSKVNVTKKSLANVTEEIRAVRQRSIDFENGFSGTELDRRLVPILLPMIRAELDRLPINGQRRSENSTPDKPVRSKPSPKIKPTEIMSTEQLEPYQVALATLLRESAGRHDPMGYLEIPIADILPHLPTEQSVEYCSEIFKQLNRCYEQSTHEVLKKGNFLRVRRPRCTSGVRKDLVAIKLEAVTPFLKESLKG